MSKYNPANLDRDRLRMREIVNSDPNSWDLAWQQNVTPWDGGEIQPPLKEAIEHTGISFPRSGRALVPGCGSGYDAVYIASTLGLDTIGYDISETALKHAQSLLAADAAKKAPSNIAFKKGDFFALEISEDEKFSLVYDYTFFVAIPPSRRLEWGQQMAKLIKPGGYLITLVFPIAPPTDIGPPFFVRPEHYLEPLQGNFEKVLDKDPDNSTPTHVGRERLLIWRRV